MAAPSPRILIAGAGVAGLVAVLCLARQGIRAQVVEKASSIRADGFILTLSHHCFDLLEDLGLVEDLRAVENGVLSSSYRDRGGRTLFELDYARLFEDGRVIQIMRDDLEAVLYRHAAGHADFRFDDMVTALDEGPDGVEATFAQGTRATFDVVIGADGVRSSVRDCAFAAGDVVRHPLGLHAAAFRARNTIGLDRRYEACLEPDRHTILYSTRGGDLAGIFIWRAGTAPLPSGTDRTTALAHLSSMYAGAPSRVRAVIDGIDPDSSLYMDELVQIEMPRWHRGRVVVVGDAAHALTQLSGQGASMAIAGAHALATALGRLPASEAFAHYERAIRPHIQALQPAVRQNARWYVPRNVVDYVMRDLLFRLVPNEVWVRYFKHKYVKA